MAVTKAEKTLKKPIAAKTAKKPIAAKTVKKPIAVKTEKKPRPAKEESLKRKDNGIVVIGSVFVDIKGYPFNTFIPGGRNAGRVEQVHGGVARNIVEDIGNVGMEPTFVGLVDDNGSGREVRDRLDHHGVNTKYMRAVPDGMGTWLAIFDTTGDVVAAISKRPDLMPILDILEEQGDEIFASADSIAIEMDMERKLLQKIFELAKKHKVKVYAAVSNMSIAAERRHYLRDVSCFVCNLQEAEILFTENFSSKQLEELVEKLTGLVKASEIESVVVTMGGQGAMYAGKNGEKGLVPAMKVDVKDTTGAGDAFFAGVVIGLTYGKNLGESCQIGTKMAASVVASLDNVCPRFKPAEILS